MILINDIEYETLEEYKASSDYNKDILDIVFEDKSELAEAREKAIKDIYDEFENTLKPLLAGYNQLDIDSFSKQLDEAKIVKAGGTSLMLNLMLKEGETVLQLADKIIKNSNLFSLAYAQAHGKKRQALANLNS